MDKGLLGDGKMSIDKYIRLVTQELAVLKKYYEWKRKEYPENYPLRMTEKEWHNVENQLRFKGGSSDKNSK